MYELKWWDVALDRLADIFVAATLAEQDRMAGAVEAFNARLRSDPFDVGESRSGTRRIAFIPLLAIGFHVSQSERTVYVTGVRRYGR